MIILKKYEIEALVSHASKDTTRLHLASVLFDGPMGTCVATDGHRLAIRNSDPFAGRFLIYRASLDQVAKLLTKKGHAVITDKAIEVRGVDGNVVATVAPKLTDAMFPPYAQVLGGYGSQAHLEPIGISPALMTDACRLFAAVGSHLAPCMVLAGKGPLDPIELSARDQRTGAWWHSIIMPMRFEGEEHTLKTADLKRRLLAKPKKVRAAKVKPVPAKKAPKKTAKRPTRKATKKVAK